MSDGFLLGCHHGTNFAQIDRACELLKAFEAKHGSQSRDTVAPKTKRTKKSPKKGSEYTTLDL